MKVASKVRPKATCTIRGVVEGQEAQQANTTRSGRREYRRKEERGRRGY